MLEANRTIAGRAFVSHNAARLVADHSGWNFTGGQPTIIGAKSPEPRRASLNQDLGLVATNFQPADEEDLLANAISVIQRSMTAEMAQRLAGGERSRHAALILSTSGGYVFEDSSLRLLPTINFSPLVGGDFLTPAAPEIERTSVEISETAQRILLAQRIKSYANLRPDWDCDGGRAPLEKDIENAVHFLQTLQGGDIPRPMVAGDGDVGFIWKTESSYLEVGFCDNGQISFYGKTRDGKKDGGDNDYANEGVPKELWKLLESIARVIPRTD